MTDAENTLSGLRVSRHNHHCFSVVADWCEAESFDRSHVDAASATDARYLRQTERGTDLHLRQDYRLESIV
jgi:hypothetical protein